MAFHDILTGTQECARVVSARAVLGQNESQMSPRMFWAALAAPSAGRLKWLLGTLDHHGERPGTKLDVGATRGYPKSRAMGLLARRPRDPDKNLGRNAFFADPGAAQLPRLTHADDFRILVATEGDLRSAGTAEPGGAGMADETISLPVGKRIFLRGHFDVTVLLEEARPLGSGYECRVRLPDGTLEEAVISAAEAREPLLPRLPGATRRTSDSSSEPHAVTSACPTIVRCGGLVDR